MKSLGCDMGAIAAKTVIMDDDRLLAYDITPNQGRLLEAAQGSIERALASAGLGAEDLDAVGGTGLGAKYIPLDFTRQTTINCLAAGGCWAGGQSSTVVDMGGLSTTLVNLDAKGKISEYRTNDRCASGTGFFMELAAQALELDIDQMGQAARDSQEAVFISGQCAVFGESEIVSHINDGALVPDIAAGLAQAIANGVVTMARRLGLEQNLVFSGGLSKNLAVIKAIEEELKMTALDSRSDPQLLCAVGAAMRAIDRRDSAGGTK